MASSTGRVQFADAHLTTDFQPVVSLDAGEVLGSEALLRPERAGAVIAPLDLLAWARAHDRLTELDLTSLRLAIASASGHGGGVVLINLEPETLILHTERVLEALAGREPGLHVVIEITERALAADPAGLLRAADALRAKGHPIAFNDVGADARSLALLEVVRPGIVKVDMAQLRDECGGQSMRIAGAVAGYAGGVGATIIATGIESDAEAMLARALGATLGQGGLWGAPAGAWPSQERESALRYAPPPLRAPGRVADAPYEIVTAHRRVAEVSAAQVAVLAATVHGCAVAEAGSCIVLGSEESSDDWYLIVLGLGTAMALVARRCPLDATADYRFAVTRDRATVVAAAASAIRALPTTRERPADQS